MQQGNYQNSNKRKLIRLPLVLAITGHSRSAWLAKVKSGEAPAPIPIGDRAKAWIEDEIWEYNERLINKARENPGSLMGAVPNEGAATPVAGGAA